MTGRAERGRRSRAARWRRRVRDGPCAFSCHLLWAWCLTDTLITAEQTEQHTMGGGNPWTHSLSQSACGCQSFSKGLAATKCVHFLNVYLLSHVLSPEIIYFPSIWLHFLDQFPCEKSMLFLPFLSKIGGPRSMCFFNLATWQRLKSTVTEIHRVKSPSYSRLAYQIHYVKTNITTDQPL